MRPSPKQLEALRIVAEGRICPTLEKEDDGWHARWRAVASGDGRGDAELAVDAWVDEYVRGAAATRLTEDAEDQRHETLHDAWIMALRSRTGLVRWDDAECRAFSEELAEWAGAAETDVAARRAIRFALEAGRRTDGGENFSVCCAAPQGRRGLKALGQSAYVWEPLRGLRSSGRGVLSVRLSISEAEDFVRRGAAALRDAGYSVAGLPEAASVTAAAETEAEEPVGDPAAGHGDCRVKLTVKVAGEAVSAEEIRFLLDQGSTLVFFRDRWIEVDRNILKAALRALEKGAGKKPNVLAFAMGIGHVGGLEIEELKAHGWLRGLVNELRSRRAESSGGSAAPPDAPSPPKGFKGTLRPYQASGVAWLKFLVGHGFGALLADDMGLGKTIQTIAWLLDARSGAGDAQPALVVAPLTLLANWRHELARFAPSLRTHMHYGDGRLSSFSSASAKANVVLTSYSLLVRDYPLFSSVAWDALVLDEAQAIKNPDTQVARAVKALSPKRRIALTGSPIENSVRDVWSIEDFLNPGFLGDLKSFRSRFETPMALGANVDAARRLRHALEPFVLRRLKSDGAIAAEIGAKREIREYCALAPDERRAYEAALAAFRATEHTQGDALALLTELKLICDGFRSAGASDERGKLMRLTDLLAAIFEGGESALVFTQYAKVGAWLQSELARRFGRTFPFLHGGLSAERREAEIRAFNRRGAGAFILSLKAGGYGLNLTKATHVIHYDRWWNPAVESQATDRAHRIGQTKDVFVHLMIAEGTVEEHVDGMLDAKSTLSSIIGDGESFWKAVNLT